MDFIIGILLVIILLFMIVNFTTISISDTRYQQGQTSNQNYLYASNNSSNYSSNYNMPSPINANAALALNKKLNSKPKPIGLVNLIESKFFKTGRSMEGTTQKSMFIEPTKNWIWYKQNQLMYPWSKLNRPIKPLQLMQYLAEYAVAENNPYVCNFLFWQDLDRWNKLGCAVILYK